jgi:drug/metabolite transporter (DMT)-like permease
MTDTTMPARPASNLPLAVLWMVGALVAFSVIAIAGREAQKSIDTYQLMFGRAVVGLIILLVIFIATRSGINDLKTQRPGLHIGRNLLHYVAQFSWLYALPLIPLATLFAVEFTGPLWVALMAPLILGERLTGTRMFSALLGFAGIIAIVGPSITSISPGLMFGLVSAVGFAASMICVKSLTRTEDAFRIIFLMHVIQIVIGLIPMATRWIWPDTTTVMWVVVVGVAGLVAHYSLTRAFAVADAIIVAPLDFLRLPLIAAVGATWYGEQLETGVLIGACIILAANIINLQGERRRPKSSEQS